MTKMLTCLWFDRGKAREAAEFYASVFPDSRVGKANASAVDIPSAKVGEDLTVEFTLLGQAYVGLNGGPDFKPNMAVEKHEAVMGVFSGKHHQRFDDAQFSH